LAYPTAPSDLRETLAMEQFISTDTLGRIKQSKPKTLNEAIQTAVELEAFYKTEQKGYIRIAVSSTTIYEGCSKSFANRYTENTQSIGI